VIDPVTVLGGGVLGVLAAMHIVRSSYSRGTFRRSAVALGLIPDERGFQSHGLRRGLPVSMGFTEDSVGEQVLALSVQGMPAGLSMYPAGLLRWERGKGPLQPLGDPVFERCFSCSGDERATFTYLDADTRAGMLALAEQWWLYCDDGALVAHAPRDAFRTSEGLTDTLSQMLDLVEGMGRGLVAHERLLKSCLSDPQPLFRSRCMALLAGTSSNEDAARRALNSLDPELRLLGAMRLGPDGWWEQVVLIRGEEPSVESRAIALAHLPASAPRELSVELARTFALGSEIALRRAALALIRRRDMIELSEVVLDCAVMQLDRLEAICGLARLQGAFNKAWRADWEVGLEVVGCLERLRSSEVEALLLRYLTLDNAAIHRATVSALGRRGTRESLLALRALQAGAGRDAGLREGLADAIAAVLARTRVADVGSLTLVASEGAEGAVSLADSSAGGVSLVDDGC